MESKILHADDEVHTFVALGLTVVQARVYLGLVRVGTSSAGVITNFSRVGRQDIYRILTELQNLGLVKKILTSPTKFEPVPIKQVLSLLLKRRDDKTSELQKAATLLCKNAGKIENSVDREDVILAVVSEIEVLHSEVMQAIKNVKTSIRLLLNSNKMKYVYQENQDWREFLQRARSLRRHQSTIKTKIITETKSMIPFPKFIEAYVKDFLLEIRYLRNQDIPTTLVICDDRQLFVQISEETSISKDTYLCLKSPVLAKIFTHYFDFLWNVSAPIIDTQKKNKTSKIAESAR